MFLWMVEVEISIIDYNYILSSEYVYTDQDFADYFHMNHLGVRKVTTQLSKLSLYFKE